MNSLTATFQRRQHFGSEHIIVVIFCLFMGDHVEVCNHGNHFLSGNSVA